MALDISSYPVADSIANALYWQPPQAGYDPTTPEGWLRPQLPALSPNATPADQALYQAIQEAYNDPSQGESLVQRVQFGDLSPGRLAETFGSGAQYTDPNLLNFAQGRGYNATLKDQFSPFGDEFFTALLGLGLATGGAAAAGGFSAAPAAAGAEAIASPLPATFGDAAPMLAASSVPADLAAGGAAVGPAATGVAGTGFTWPQILGSLSVAQSGANLAQNPSGASAGGLLGSSIGLATGVPGLGLVGSLAGGGAQQLAGGQGGGNVAEGQQGGIDLGTALAAALGLGGTGLSLAGGFQQAGRQDQLYSQSQQSYQQAQQLYQILTQLAQLEQQQRQQQYGQQQSQYGLNQDIFGYNAYNIYPQVQQQIARDQANREAVFGERQAAGQRLTDPAQAQAGINTMTTGLQGKALDEVLRGVQRDAAMRGVGDGGGYQDILATALARLNLPYQQMGASNYLATQGLGLGQFTYPPQGPYTPFMPSNTNQVPGAPQTAQYPQVPTPYQYASYIPQASNPAQTIGGASNLIGNLVNALGLGRLFTGGTGSTGAAGVDTLGLATGGYSPSLTGTGAGIDPYSLAGVGGGIDPYSTVGFGAGLGAEFSADPSLLSFTGGF